MKYYHFNKITLAAKIGGHNGALKSTEVSFSFSLPNLRGIKDFFDMPLHTLSMWAIRKGLIIDRDIQREVYHLLGAIDRGYTRENNGKRAFRRHCVASYLLRP